MSLSPDKVQKFSKIEQKLKASKIGKALKYSDVAEKLRAINSYKVMKHEKIEKIDWKVLENSEQFNKQERVKLEQMFEPTGDSDDEFLHLEKPRGSV